MLGQMVSTPEDPNRCNQGIGVCWDRAALTNEGMVGLLWEEPSESWQMRLGTSRQRLTTSQITLASWQSEVTSALPTSEIGGRNCNCGAQ